MTDLSRGVRVRRSGRRPGWVLLTALLVLAIGASSALVFTNQVELLKLAVILALWAAVVAAFVSVIYRRQSDVDQARARDLKLVYDLQLDREISARREYELTVESQLRRELATELRAQASDEVSELRAELAALRTNLEILFDAELSERPALESERRSVRGYGEWDRDNESARERINRVQSVRAEEPAQQADDSIIDVHEEPLVPASPRQPAAESSPPSYAPQPHEYASPRQGRPAEQPEPDRGSHRRSGEQETSAARNEPAPTAWAPSQAPAGPVERPQDARNWAPQQNPAGAWAMPGPPPATGPEQVEPRRSRRRAGPPAQPEPQFAPRQDPESPRRQPRIPWLPPTEAARQPEAPRRAEAPRQPEQAAAWQPVSSQGQWVPAGQPDSNWSSNQATGPAPASWADDNGPSRDEPSHRSPAIDEPVESQPQRRGRHSSPPPEPAPGQPDEPVADDRGESGRRARSRHSADQSDPAGAEAAPAPAMSPAPAPPPPPTPPTPDRGPAMSPPPPASARHRSTDPLSEAEEPQSGGQSVADLLARLQTTPSEGGGRRRRRED